MSAAALLQQAIPFPGEPDVRGPAWYHYWYALSEFSHWYFNPPEVSTNRTASLRDQFPDQVALRDGGNTIRVTYPAPGRVVDIDRRAGTSRVVSTAAIGFANSTLDVAFESSFVGFSSTDEEELKRGPKCNLRVFSIDEGKTIAEAAIRGSPNHVVFSPDNEVVVFTTTAGTPGSDRLWTWHLRSQPKAFEAPPMLALCFVSSGRYVIAVSGDGRAQIWSPSRGAVLSTWDLGLSHLSEPTTIAASGSGVIALGASGAVHLYWLGGALMFAKLGAIKTEDTWLIPYGAKFISDDLLLLRSRARLVVFDAHRQTEIYRSGLHPNPIEGICGDARLGLLIAASTGQRNKLYAEPVPDRIIEWPFPANTTTKALSASGVLDTYSLPVRTAFAASGRVVAAPAKGRNGEAIVLTQVHPAGVVPISSRVCPQEGPADNDVECTRFSPGGTVLVAGYRPAQSGLGVDAGMFRLWSLNPSDPLSASEILTVKDAHREAVSAIAFADDRRFATASRDATVIWELRGSELSEGVRVSGDWLTLVRSMAYSSRAERLYVEGRDDVTEIDARTGATLNRIRRAGSGAGAGVLCMRLSPQEDSLAIGWTDGWLTIHKVAGSGFSLSIFVEPSPCFRSIAFSGDARFVAVGSEPGDLSQIKFFWTDDGAPAGDLGTEASPIALDCPGDNNVLFASVGELVACGGGQHGMVAWHMSSPRDVWEQLRGSPDPVLPCRAGWGLYCNDKRRTDVLAQCRDALRAAPSVGADWRLSDILEWQEQLDDAIASE